ncbi:3-hydroxyisobutyryl-CoA hydrolase 1-like isoform X2 [Durio zibethinus]|uniref:3-hydroxyisobutyryl-CoA hydrolase n=1 Tax=Durio zibethinus TaxID=66656 RepID=A0A6P6AL44_DURZI|nr:3-hydroxyisobutyryl-CoA hydrolase 1-like isoform X2 [Durio zibethinus]
MASSVSPQQDEVLVEANSFARTLTLNRPKQLNALSFQMISRLLELFLAYEEDPNVKLVIVKGKGRAFCAGGDVAAVVRDIRAGANFFLKEFTLNYLMATYSKPQVSILNGIVMGGGAGASVHGRFRVATENSVFAMPETALGLFPDVGASYFLSRLPGFFGEYVGLTGSRLDGAEMLACGLATHFVPSAKLPMLEAALCDVDSSDPAIISSIIDQYCEQPSLNEQSVYNRLDVIDRCFSQKTVEEILSALEREVVHRMDGWISATIQTLKKASPTSLKISLRSIRKGRLQGVGPCLVREYRMVCHVMRGEVSKDFFEGCRALLLDKDKNPKWEPSKLELIADGTVDCYFSKVNNEDWEDLKLPTRSKFNLPPFAIAKL